MNRCLTSPCSAIDLIANYAIKSAAVAVLGAFLSVSATAQTPEAAPAPEPEAAKPGVRSFPPNARRATLQVLTAPEVLLDGKAERLSPGARIRNPQNFIVMPASIAGPEFVVNVLRNPMGELQEVWLLTPQEAAEKIKFNTASRNFIFGSEANSGQAKDDGKTPFNQLPSFEELGKQQRAQQR